MQPSTTIRRLGGGTYKGKPEPKPAAPPLGIHMMKAHSQVTSPAIVAAPKLGALPAAQLPKLGNRFFAVRFNASIPNNARQSRKILERNETLGGAKASAAKASVILFDPIHLDELRNVKSNLSSMLNEIGLKTSDGHWIVPAARAKTLIEMGTNAEVAYKDCARTFLDKYERVCRDWAENLGDDYDERAYPAIDKVARQLGISLDPSKPAETGRKRGFTFTMTAIADHDGGTLEQDMGLTLDDTEKEFIAESARAHYQSVVDQAFEQLQEAVTKIVEGDQKGRRVKQLTIKNAREIAEKIEALGIDQKGVAAATKQLTSRPVPIRSKDDAARDQYTARAKAILDDLNALTE